MQAQCAMCAKTPEGHDTQALFVPHPSVWYLYRRNLVHGPRHPLTVRRTSTMSDLIALVLDSREQAQEARQEFMQMQREHLVELEDCVVAYKDDAGHVKLDQTLNLTATGAAAGGFWGL